MILFQLAFGKIHPDEIRENSKIKDKMHAVVFVINASMFAAIDESIIEKLKNIKEAAEDRGTNDT